VHQQVAGTSTKLSRTTHARLTTPRRVIKPIVGAGSQYMSAAEESGSGSTAARTIAYAGERASRHAD
jgi:hypothetical protein